MATAIPLINSMRHEWLIVVPGVATVIASLLGVNDAAAKFIQRGGRVRIIVDVTYSIIDNVRELLAIGEEVRHSDQLGVVFLRI